MHNVGSSSWLRKSSQTKIISTAFQVTLKVTIISWSYFAQLDLCHQYRNFHQHHHCHHQSIYRHNHHHHLLLIIIVCNRNIRRATVLSLIFIPQEGIRSPFLSALKMFTHEHHTVPYFFLQCSQGQKHFCSWFYLLQKTHTTPLCSCNFHRTTTLSCSCYRYTPLLCS